MNREQLLDLISAHLGGTYWCNRVWSAWRYGTMSESDFHDISETDIPHDLTEAILAQLEPPTMTTDNTTHVNPITIAEVRERMRRAASHIQDLVKSVYDNILPDLVQQIRTGADREANTIYFKTIFEFDPDGQDGMNVSIITNALEMLEKAHPGFSFSAVSVSDSHLPYAFDIGCRISWDEYDYL